VIPSFHQTKNKYPIFDAVTFRTFIHFWIQLLLITKIKNEFRLFKDDRLISIKRQILKLNKNKLDKTMKSSKSNVALGQQNL
jgi:hypothetical protein